MRFLSRAWDWFALKVTLGVYSSLYFVLRPVMRSIGGDFWLECRHCGGVMPPETMQAHIQRHKDNGDIS